MRWLFSKTICILTLLRDFTDKTIHRHAFFTMWVCIQTHLPVSPFLLILSHSPKGIAGTDITDCLTHTCYSCMTGYETLEVWADAKSCRDISRQCKDYLVYVTRARKYNGRVITWPSRPTDDYGPGSERQVPDCTWWIVLHAMQHNYVNYTFVMHSVQCFTSILVSMVQLIINLISESRFTTFWAFAQQ